MIIQLTLRYNLLCCLVVKVNWKFKLVYLNDILMVKSTENNLKEKKNKVTNKVNWKEVGYVTALADGLTNLQAVEFVELFGNIRLIEQGIRVTRGLKSVSGSIGKILLGCVVCGLGKIDISKSKLYGIDVKTLGIILKIFVIKNFMYIVIENNLKEKKNKVTNKANWKEQQKLYANPIMIMAITWDRLIEFFYIWPLEQWVSSLVGLVLLYWFTTTIYNKRLAKYNLNMSVLFRVYMISLDLLLNLGVGLYYLDFRETTLGNLMVLCPIAISPLIFLVEFLIIILLKEYEIHVQRKARKTKIKK